MHIPAIVRHTCVVVLSGVFLNGCGTAEQLGFADRPATSTTGSAFYSTNFDGDPLSPPRQDRISYQLVEDALNALETGNLEEASHRANAALKFDITNPRLQFLNAFVYHQMGLSGDTSKYELAEQGYLQSLKFDPSNLRAQYQLGRLYLAQREYGLAKGYFASVALDDEDNPAVLYNLAMAAYYARDPATAETVLRKLLTVAPEMVGRPEFVQALSIAKAAVGAAEEANAVVSRYGDLLQSANTIDFVERRLRNWENFYAHDALNLSPRLRQVAEVGDANDIPMNEDMVVVEVVLIGTQEDARRSRGINLLDGLQLQFGDSLENIPGFSFGETRIEDQLNSGLAENTQTITNFINIPAITYSLNIANALDSYGEILAKPSLVALSGETSEFFSGTEVLAAAVSGGDGDSVSVEKEVGVKLAVTPTILSDGQIRLHVAAERTFLTDPSTSVLFEFRLDTTKTNINSTVTMGFDETLVLGGLTERETSNSDDGVPIIREIPGINLLFSEESSRVFERSIMILITPRRPNFTNDPAEANKQAFDGIGAIARDIERFEQRHRDLFGPRNEFRELIQHVDAVAFAEEFHMSDMPPKTWTVDGERTANSTGRLKAYLLSEGL